MWPSGGRAPETPLTRLLKSPKPLPTPSNEASEHSASVRKADVAGSRTACSLTTGLLLRGHGELVGPVVPALVRPASLEVPLHLPPSHFQVAPCRFQEPLPQVPVRHRLSEVVEPSVLPPLLVPTAPHAVDEVGAVRVDAHDVPFVYRFKSDTRGGQFHPKVGGVQLAATYLLGFALPRHDGPVAAWAAGANGCPVGIGVSLLSSRLRQGRQRSCIGGCSH